MRRTHSLVALLLALATCASLAALVAVDLRRAAPDRSPRAAIADAQQERARARDARFTAKDRSFDVAFDRAMVRDRVTWSSPGTPRTTDVVVVNATPGADLAATARACAAAQGDATRVQCYAFASTEAYEFKDITGDMQLATPTAIVNLCWAVLASNERAGGPLALSDMRQAAQVWEAQQCPDSWAGTATPAEATA